MYVLLRCMQYVTMCQSVYSCDLPFYSTEYVGLKNGHKWFVTLARVSVNFHSSWVWASLSDLFNDNADCDILRLQSESYKALAFPTPVGKPSIGILSCPIHLMTLRQSCCEQTQATRRSHGQVLWLMVFQSSPVR